MVSLKSRPTSGSNVGTSHSYGSRQGSLLQQRRGQLQHKRLCSASFLMRFFFASTIAIFFSSFFLLSSHWHYYDSYSGEIRLQEYRHVQIPSFLSPEAYPVYGIQADFHQTDGKGKNQTVSAVYAIPGFNDYSLKSSPLKNRPRIKGIVILLHACTHNALKFFAPSSTCPDCIGLSEEMRLARIVLERGYAAVAITANSRGGCWGGANDMNAIKTVLRDFPGHWLQTTHRGTLEIDDSPSIYALGASSGGGMAARIVAEGIAESGTVMVMGLGNDILDRISSLPVDPERKLYLAPMTRDKGTAKRVRDNYKYWMNKQEKKQEQGGPEMANKRQHEILVDEISCLPLPVTADYLWNRVPGMTLEAAQVIVRILLDHKHLDPSTQKLIVNPTTSNWRDFFLQVDLPVPNTLRLSQNQQKKQNEFYRNYISELQKKSSMVLWEAFDLTPGISPLTKALHRAWAMHEYCSETVSYSLDFFEGKKTKQEIIQIIDEQILNSRENF